MWNEWCIESRRPLFKLLVVRRRNVSGAPRSCCEIMLGDISAEAYGGPQGCTGAYVCLEVPMCAWSYLGVPRYT